MKTKVLVTGAKGQLGSEIRKISGLFPEIEFCFTDIEELDITNPWEVADFLNKLNPQFLINCAAYTAVDKAETDTSLSSLLNATAVGILAEQSANIACKIIHISTDYVFNGRGPRPYKEDDCVDPQSAYGKTKLEGEVLCQKNNPESIIIRTSWLYSAFGNNFVKTMVRLSNEKSELAVIADQIGSPTNAADLAHAILTIISSVINGTNPFAAGIYHYSNEGVASWYDFAKAIFDMEKINCIVKPIASEDFPSPVKRPSYSVMNKSKIKLIFGLQIPHWRDSLTVYFQNKIKDMATNQDVLESVKLKAAEWLTDVYDEATKSEVRRMLNNEDPTELIDSFYRDLEFGTGGLRGIMGAGTNRMNIYTVGAATQGLSNYLKKEFAHLPEIKAAIGYDCRNNSRLFSETSAEIFSANGIKVFLFEDLRPTPELSFAVRELGCQSGIILTASHNPKEYNGYKAYWDDGSQIVSPHDENIIDEVSKVKATDIKFKGNKSLITILGADMDNLFLEKVKTVSISPEVVLRQKDLKIVYTPIHGTGVRLIPAALRAFGFTNIINVPEQDVVDGNFPTVVSPNPEETAALAMAIAKAVEVDADVVLASDPDADRLGVAVKNDKGEFVILNGNQTALVFIYYIISKRKESNKLLGNEFIVKTIVTTELIAKIAEQNKVDFYDVFTGFKYIAEVIRDLEGKKVYIGGGEESFGFMPADFVRDKDAVSSCALMAEIVAWAKDQGKSLYEMLLDIYLEYGYSREKMKYVVRKGKTGAEEIQQMMVKFRTNPPEVLGGSKLKIVKDYETLIATNLLSREETKIDQKTSSNVLQFFTEDGTKISVRPSGTEPKIKFYFEVAGKFTNRADYDAVEKLADDKIEAIMQELDL